MKFGKITDSDCISVDPPESQPQRSIQPTKSWCHLRQSACPPFTEGGGGRDHRQDDVDWYHGHRTYEL